MLDLDIYNKIDPTLLLLVLIINDYSLPAVNTKKGFKVLKKCLLKLYIKHFSLLKSSLTLEMDRQIDGLLDSLYR